jgi:tetratricopeptide (TPR) repeat protein
VQGLRERGYFDLAVEYLEQLRKSPETPPELRAVIDYEIGKSLLEEASRSADLERRRVQFDQASAKLEAFAKANPKHPLAPDALAQMARLLVERGMLAMIQGGEAAAPAEKQAKIAEARSLLKKGRDAYEQALKPLRAAYEGFPKFIAQGDARREERDRAHVALMDSQLKRALVDYQEAQTYPAGSTERNDLLSKAQQSFESMYKEHRTQLAGLYARMWQGKCYEEQSELGKAMGIYNELMEHGDPRLRPLQRHVGYFRIIIDGKRKEYALAADEAGRWLQANPRDRHGPEGLGVLLELAKSIVAQLDGLSGAELEAAKKRLVDVLTEVVHFYSPHKFEALALLQKYKPKAAAGATIPANLTYDDAMAQADLALSSQEWTRAIALLKAAIRRADPTREPEKANRARYQLAFAYYQNQNYYEAAVLAEHLARRYPQGGLSADATKIGMAAFTFAYNTFTQRDRTADLNHLVELAKYTAATWPDTDQGDAARITLGEIYSGQGKYAQAAKQFEEVRSNSSRHADAEAKAGGAHWRQSLVLRDSGKTSEGDAEAKQAETLLKEALKTRQSAGATASDPSLLMNACDLAEIYLATERPKESQALVEPLARELTPKTPPEGLLPAVSRLLATLLRTHVGLGQVDQALADMNRLETLGGGASLTQLYYELGKLLKKQMETLQARGDQMGYDRTQQAFQHFLQALVKSKSGQSYESLQWAGEAMLGLSESAHEQAEALRARRLVREADATDSAGRALAGEAAAVFEQILNTYGKDETFRQRPNGEAQLFRTKLRQVSAFRNERDFSKATQLVESLIDQNKRILDPQLEKGLLLEDQAAAGKGKWSDAYEHWRGLAATLGRGARKPKEYYEASYHVAYVLFKEGQKDEAKKALRSVMRLSPTVGGPDMKAKYETLLKQIGT